jgi:RNA polymerase sigma-70 factor (ECF subfamily)
MDIIKVLPFLTKFAKKLDYYNHEDLVNDTVIKLLERKDKFDGTNLQGWSGKIMFNLFVSKCRRNKFNSIQDNELLFANLQSNNNQEETLYLKQILTQLETFSIEHKNILIQSALGNQYNELAIIFNIPIGTVRSRLARARTKLLELNTEIK